jgi:hypothetical protein
VKSAVALLDRCHAAVQAGRIDDELLALHARVTDCNSAFFDVANDFRGCIAGCLEVLRRQGLLAGTWCLDPAEGLSPGRCRRSTASMLSTEIFASMILLPPIATAGFRDAAESLYAATRVSKDAIVCRRRASYGAMPIALRVGFTPLQPTLQRPIYHPDILKKNGSIDAWT